MKKKNIAITTKDYLVSGESFQLRYDDTSDMLITIPQPPPEKLSAYYRSEAYHPHHDARKTIFQKTYHLVKRYLLKRKLKRITALCPEKGALLDIGAGTGDFLQAAQKQGWAVYGVEPNATARTAAKQKGISVESELRNLPSQRYEVITLWHALEHLPHLEEQLQELKKRLKPDGIIVVAVPNYNSFDAAYYKTYWAGYDVPRHLWHFSRQAIHTLFAAKGFKVIQTIPMPFDAFYISLLSEKYKTGKMHFLKAALIGAISNGKAFFKTGDYSSLTYIIAHQKDEL
jgi:2-polyprenyl-3-methyl-5-hydroxy-6-metoxy-1,4-benzoquinol methylase